jgi:hypothetical protein
MVTLSASYHERYQSADDIPTSMEDICTILEWLFCLGLEEDRRANKSEITGSSAVDVEMLRTILCSILFLRNCRPVVL